jgi:hypothetical protein
MSAVSGSPTQVKTSCATLAEMGGTPDDAFLDGEVAYVSSVRRYFQIVRQDPSLVANGSTIVATFSGNGFWVALDFQSLAWSYQPTWYIDSVNGNDENDGSTALTALQTWDEFTRRVSIVAVAMTVNILAAVGQSIVGTFKPANIVASLTIQGVPTVLASSTVTTFVDPVPATNSRGTVTATGIDFALYLGKIARSTGTDVLLPILSNSVAVGQGGYWANGFTNTKPANNSPLEVIDPVPVNTVQIMCNALPVQVKYLACTSTNFQDLPIINFGAAKIPSTFFAWIGCAFAYGLEVVGISTYLSGCVGTGTSFSIITDGNLAAFVGGGSRGAVSINLGNVSFQGFQIDCANTPLLMTGQMSIASDSTAAPLGVYASTANRSGIYLQQNAFFRSGGATYGSVPNYGVLVTDGGKFMVPSGTPTVTGTTGDMQIQGATSVVAPPTAGGVWAAAVDLSGTGGVGWGKWVAGGKQFVNYGTLAAITI